MSDYKEMDHDSLCDFLEQLGSSRVQCERPSPAELAPVTSMMRRLGFHKGDKGEKLDYVLDTLSSGYLIEETPGDVPQLDDVLVFINLKRTFSYSWPAADGRNPVSPGQGPASTKKTQAPYFKDIPVSDFMIVQLVKTDDDYFWVIADLNRTSPEVWDTQNLETRGWRCDQPDGLLSLLGSEGFTSLVREWPGNMPASGRR